MTENQAREKWCPMYRANSNSDYRDNRTGMEIMAGRCIASDCMAWRWSDEPRPETETGYSMDGAGGGSYHSKPPTDGDGYCGLAGKP